MFFSKNPLYKKELTNLQIYNTMTKQFVDELQFAAVLELVDWQA